MNITAWNTSSSSIIVKWEEVPLMHRKGIITEYGIYVKQATPNAPETRHTVQAPTREIVIGSLDLWTFYEVKVYASTAVGAGNKSAIIRVRTDADSECLPLS